MVASAMCMDGLGKAKGLYVVIVTSCVRFFVSFRIKHMHVMACICRTLLQLLRDAHTVLDNGFAKVLWLDGTTKYLRWLYAEQPAGCWVTGGSYRETCAPGVWVTTQSPSIDCLLCTACNPFDTAHPLTCTQAPSTCTDITNVNGQIICNTPPPTCVAAGGSCDSSNTCCAGLVCHASGGPGASCYGPSRKMLLEV